MQFAHLLSLQIDRLEIYSKYEKDVIELKKDSAKMLQIAKYLKPYGFWIFVSMVCSLSDVALKLLIPYIMKGLMDTATSKNFALFSYYLYISAGLIIFAILVAYFGKYAARRYNLSFTRDMKNHITEHVQRMPVYILKDYSTGDIVSRVNNDLSIVSNLYNSIPVIIFQPLLMIIAIIYMLSISWKLTLASILLIPISSILFDKINKPIQVYSKELMEQSSILNTLLQDAIGGIHILKAFNLGEPLNEKFEIVAEDIQLKGLKISKINACLTPVFLALQLIPQFIYPLYGGYLTLNKEMTLGSLFAFGPLIWYGFGPVQSILGFIGQIRETKPAFKRICELLDEPLETNDGIAIWKNTETAVEKNIEVAIESNAKRAVENCAKLAIGNNAEVAIKRNPVGAIEESTTRVIGNNTGAAMENSIIPASMEFDSVTFSYDNVLETGKTLDNVSFKLAKGSMTAIVGPSGSGKSTILKLICGFYKPSVGSMKLFDRDFNDYKLEDLRSQISYMSQESYLYPSTIAENIAIGNKDATRDEIITAAKAAHAHEFITKLPQGYDTFAGEKGNFLSGGQCQRIALARMILKDSPIILLDEPTASLDPKSEAFIQDSLKKLTKNKTILVVAHRLSTIKEAQQILVLENASIKERGTHEELIGRDGLYKKLYSNQFSSIQEEASAC
jgi:ABC-type multidrug transport system fused ATPase/permease subunit